MNKWPKSPYKGFSSYGPGDTLLYAGRESQIIEFSREVTHPDTRILLLHGKTGCGKSSFLRAGVIPYLEGGQRGVEFLRLPTAGIQQLSSAFFVRSTNDPLARLAEKIFAFCEQGHEFESPFGRERLDFTAALHGCRTADEFEALVSKAPGKLVDTLRAMASQMPSTLILVVDQGEEVLTLDSDDEETETTEAFTARKTYFDFLAQFGTTEFDLKLVIALRTEYFGLFVDGFRRLRSRGVEFKDYVLPNLFAGDLVRAILRPTSVKDEDGKPGEFYRFTYEPGLPEHIVHDIRKLAKRGGLVGGALPVMQIVCETLYRNTLSKGEDGRHWTITLSDYQALGEIETQLGDYVDDVVLAFHTLHNTPLEVRGQQTYYAKDSLVPLAKTQVDNTITTDIKRIDDLQPSGGMKILHWNLLLEYLADDEQNILRKEKVKEVACFSLRHDAVGLVLLRWKNAREGTAGLERRLQSDRRGGAWIGIVSSIVLAGYSVYALLDKRFLAAGFCAIASAAYAIGSTSNWRSSRNLPGLQVFDSVIRRADIGTLWQRRDLPSWLRMPAKVMYASSASQPIGELLTNPVFRLYFRSNPTIMERVDRILAREAASCTKSAEDP